METGAEGAADGGGRSKQEETEAGPRGRQTEGGEGRRRRRRQGRGGGRRRGEKQAGGDGGRKWSEAPFPVGSTPRPPGTLPLGPRERSESGAVTGAPGRTFSVIVAIRKAQQASDRRSPGLLLHRSLLSTCSDGDLGPTEL